jgi:predicted small integral membrane protein
LFRGFLTRKKQVLREKKREGLKDLRGLSTPRRFELKTAFMKKTWYHWIFFLLNVLLIGAMALYAFNDPGPEEKLGLLIFLLWIYGIIFLVQLLAGLYMLSYDRTIELGRGLLKGLGFILLAGAVFAVYLMFP